MLEKINLLADCPVQDALKSFEALSLSPCLPSDKTVFIEFGQPT